MADMRKLDARDSWICMGDTETPRNKKEGAGCKIEGYGNQVFFAKGAGVEMWSEVVMETKERVMQRNLLGRSGSCLRMRMVLVETEYLVRGDQIFFFHSVQDRISQSTGPNPDRDRQRPNLVDRRSRSGPVDRTSVGLCGTLHTPYIILLRQSMSLES